MRSKISRPPRHSAARGARAASAAVGAGAMFGFTKKKKDGSVKGGSVRSGSDRGTTRSSAKSLTKSATRKDGAKARGAQPGLDDDDYGELFDEGALETFAEEGVDSDVEAEENERYVRRPRPAEERGARATEGGFLHRQPCRAGSRLPPRTTRRRTRTRSLRTSSRWISCTGTGHTTAATTWRTTWTGSSSTPPPPSACATTPKRTRLDFFTAHTTAFYASAMHPDGEIVATGQAGPDPSICVWSSTTCVSCSRSSKGSTRRAVVSLSFDGTGRF